MATWTAPKTWTSTGVTAAEFNEQIRDNETWLKGAFTQLNVTSDSAKAKITPALFGCHVTKTADQTFTTGVTAAISFDFERFDSDAFHDNATNPTRVTIPASSAGYYICGGNLAWASNATGQRQCAVQLNGTTLIAIDSDTGLGTGVTYLSTMVLWFFAAADYVELLGNQTSGGNLNVTALSAVSPNLWIHRHSSS